VRCINSDNTLGPIKAGSIYTIKQRTFVAAGGKNHPCYLLKEIPETYFEFRFELAEKEPMQLAEPGSVEITQDELTAMQKIASGFFTAIDLQNAEKAISKTVDALQAGKSVLPPSDPWYQDNYGRWCRRNV